MERENAKAAERKLATLRQALIEGERSGTPAPFDFKAFKRRKVEERG